MKAFFVILNLSEKNGDDEFEPCDTSIRIITVAKSLSSAAEFAETAYTKADKTEPNFKWEAIHVEQINGTVALPVLPHEVIPETG